MVQCTFYVQSNLNAVESEKIQKACEGWGFPVVLFKVIPFTGKMPRLNAEPPFIFVGSTTLNRNCLKSRKYKNGVFFNDNFCPSQYAAHWGENYLNHDMLVFKLQDVPKDLYLEDTQVFIRSDDDSKDVSGGVGLFGGLLEIQKNTETHWINGDLFSPQSRVCVAPVKNLYAEYRILFCEGRIIGHSRYKPSVDYGVPGDVLDFARRMQSTWQPHAVFVMDVGETDEGLKIVECNCINGSGWYQADYARVVDSLARYQIRAHTQIK